MPELKERPKGGKGGSKPRPQSPLSPQQAAKLLKDKYVKQLEQRPEGETAAEAQAAGQVEDAGTWAVDELAVRAVPRQRERTIKEKPKDVRQSADRTASPASSASNGIRERPVSADRTVVDRVPGDPPAIKERGISGTAASPRRRPDTGQPFSRTPTRKAVTTNRDLPVEKVDSTTRQPVRGKVRPSQASGQIRGVTAPPGRPTPQRQTVGRIRQGREQASATSQMSGHIGTPSTQVPGRRAPRGRVSSGGIAPKAKGIFYPKGLSRPKAGGVPAKGIFRPDRGIHQAGGGQMLRASAQRTQKAAKTAAAFLKKAVVAVTKAASALVSALAALAGGGILLIAMVVVIVIAAVASSPFGLFFAQERNAPDTVSVAEAVASVNVSYNAKLEELQSGDYDSIEISGQAADWAEVLAVFAVKTAGVDTGIDVATLDADRVDRLIAVFGDMNTLTTEVETVSHGDSDPDDDVDDSWTERILHITITAKTADDMRTAYSFTDYQNSALDDLLADRAALASLAGSLSITNADAQAVLDALPADLSPERRAVVEAALTLYGKVNYFWGGKSLVLGWDSRWGQVQKVSAAGSPTTGTYRPYGLDCSGFVDWAFYNATGGSYIIGHGGGAHAQHTYCSSITWAEAQPGDLVFYPSDSHVGIVCGRDESGNLLVIHCASGANNVVITGTSGFTSIGRPNFFNE